MKRNRAAVFAWASVFLFPLIAYAEDGDPTGTGTTVWMLTSAALVLLMVPGLAMFFGGLIRTKKRSGDDDAQLCCHGARGLIDLAAGLVIHVSAIIRALIAERTLDFRIDEEREVVGIDYTLHGEHGYGLISS